MKHFSFAPSNIQGNCPRVVVSGWEEVLIEEHKGLFSYESRCIRVRTGQGLLEITGEELIISYFGAQDLLIHGRVRGVKLQEGVQ